MSSFIDLQGQRFSRLVVLRRSAEKSKGAKWVCVCDCGKEKEVFSYNLRSGHTTSCGCYSGEVNGSRLRTHGLSGTKEHRSWKLMIRRCTDTNWHMYERYGAKGIAVAPEWFDFSVFLADMGKAPTEMHTIERKDNSKGYSKENCKWADATEQSRNRSVVKMTIEKARKSHELRAQGMGETAIAQEVDVPVHCVHDVLRGRTFKESRDFQ